MVQGMLVVTCLLNEGRVIVFGDSWLGRRGAIALSGVARHGDCSRTRVSKREVWGLKLGYETRYFAYCFENVLELINSLNIVICET